MTSKWIVCSPINVEEIDNKEFLNTTPSGKVFRCEQHGKEYIVSYKGQSYTIARTEFQEVDEPEFMIGEFVKIKDSGACAEIVDIFWHYQKKMPFYFIVCKGKRSSKRYFGHEFTKQ